MMRTPKTPLTYLGVAALILAIGGCSNGGPNNQESDGGPGDSPGQSEYAGELLYSIWDERQAPALRQMADDFTEMHPDVNISVEITPPDQYWTKLQTQATGGNLPDVFWMNGPNVKVYAPNDVLEPMTSLIESGQVDPSNYPETLNELYTVDGVQYGVPKDFDTIAVWYNEDVLERAGVEAPAPDWTWDEFRSAANTVSEELGDEGVYGVVTDLAGGGQQGYYNTIFQAGGYVLSEDGKSSGFDDPRSIEGLAFWADLIASGASPSMQQLSDTEPNQWFTSGRAGMYWSGSWMASEIADSGVAEHVSTVQMPAGERHASVIHGLANVVAADSDNKDAALAFAAYMGSEEAALTKAEYGAAIPAFNGTQDAWVASTPSFGLETFLDVANDSAVPDPSSQNTDVWRAAERELLPQAFSGDRPVEEVAQELADRMNAALAEE